MVRVNEQKTLSLVKSRNPINLAEVVSVRFTCNMIDSTLTLGDALYATEFTDLLNRDYYELNSVTDRITSLSSVYLDSVDNYFDRVKDAMKASKGFV